MTPNLKLQEAIRAILSEYVYQDKYMGTKKLDRAVDTVVGATQSIIAEESGGQALYNDLCRRLIGRILAFNPDEHDIELNLCGIIAKAQLPKPSGECKLPKHCLCTELPNGKFKCCECGVEVDEKPSGEDTATRCEIAKAEGKLRKNITIEAICYDCRKTYEINQHITDFRCECGKLCYISPNKEVVPDKIARTANNEILAITYEGKQYYPKELHPSLLLTHKDMKEALEGEFTREEIKRGITDRCIYALDGYKGKMVKKPSGEAKQMTVEDMEKIIEKLKRVSVGNHDDSSRYFIPTILLEPIATALFEAVYGGRKE